MKALGLVVSDKKIFESFILKTYFFTPWPTYATNWNGLNNFDRGQPRDHSFEVWSKSNQRFQRRCCLKKLLTNGRTPDIEGSQKLTDHFVLRWAKKCEPFRFQIIFIKIFAFLNTIIWPRELLKQPVRTILLKCHPMIIVLSIWIKLFRRWSHWEMFLYNSM